MLISDDRQLDDAARPAVAAGQRADQRRASRSSPCRSTGCEPDVVFARCRRWARAAARYRLVLTLHDLIYYTNRTPPPRLRARPLRLLWRLYHLAWWPQRLLLDRADAVVTVSETTRGLDRRAPPDAEAGDGRAERRRPAAEDGAAGRAAPGRAATSSTWARSCRTRTSSHAGAGAAACPTATTAPHEPGLGARSAPRLEAPRARRRRWSSTTARATTSTAPSLLGAHRAGDGVAGRGLRHPARRGAWRSARPSVVSDIPIFREIGGDAALYFDAGRRPGFAAAVRRSRGEWRRALGGVVRQAARFSWAASADGCSSCSSAWPEPDASGQAPGR